MAIDKTALEAILCSLKYIKPVFFAARSIISFNDLCPRRNHTGADCTELDFRHGKFSRT